MLQCGLRKKMGALGVVLGTSQYIVRWPKHNYIQKTTQEQVNKKQSIRKLAGIFLSST
jgi:hypothetical protein